MGDNWALNYASSFRVLIQIMMTHKKSIWVGKSWTENGRLPRKNTKVRANKGVFRRNSTSCVDPAHFFSKQKTIKTYFRNFIKKCMRHHIF